MQLITHALVVIIVLVLASSVSYFFRNRVVRLRRLQMAKRASAPKKYLPLPPPQSAVGVAVAPLPNPYPPYHGLLRINDPLRDNSAGYHWMDDQEKMTRDTQGCHFCDETYRVSIGNQQTAFMIYCLAMETNFSNFVYQIEATLLQGTEIGIVFRQTAQHGYYYFCIRRDGTYGLLCEDRPQQRRLLLTTGRSSLIKVGLNQPNLLAVVASGSIIDLYVNQQHLTQVSDAAHEAGRLSVASATDPNSPSEASFRNLMLWTLDEAADAVQKVSLQ